VNIKKEVDKRTVTKNTSVVLASTTYKLAKGKSERFDLTLTKIGRSSLLNAAAKSSFRPTFIASVKGGTTARKALAKAAHPAGSNGAPSVSSIESAICAAAFPSGINAGDHCGVTNLKVSTVDPNWVFGAAGFYNAQDQPDSDEGDVILNLSTHQLIGPTGDGFCGQGDTGIPVPGYSSVPANVLVGFGLSPCSSTTTTTVASSTTLPPTTTTTVPSTTTLPPTTTTGAAPILGSAAWGQALGSFGGISGFGQVAPANISLGPVASDPHVYSISWSNWGAPQAMGQGQAIDGTGQSGPVSSWPVVPATVVAFDLGSCDGGPPAYQEVTWYFPQDGETFDPTMATNACTGQ
jgi:hypothetical protein